MNLNLRRLGISLAASLLITGLAGCELPGSAGSDKQQNGGDQQNQTAKSIHEGSISKDETWKKADGPHLVRGVVNVESENGAMLTIEPGTVVLFEKGASLRIGTGTDSGVLKAIGTAGESIIFTSALSNKAKGDWNAIVIGNGGASTVLEHCEIRFGGGDISYPAAVLVDGLHNNPTIRNCIFENNAGYALQVTGHASLTAFENNMIKTSESNPLRLPASRVGKLGAGNKYEGNGVQAIHVEGDSIETSARWLNQGIPYRVLNDNIRVGGEKGLAVLTIDPGTVLEFGNRIALWISYGLEGAALYAVGDENNPIRFTGVRKDRGAWEGIGMYGGTQTGDVNDRQSTVIRHAIIEYAASHINGAMLELDDAKPYIKDVTFQHAAENKHAIRVRGLKSKVPTHNDLFTGNTFVDFGGLEIDHDAN